MRSAMALSQSAYLVWRAQGNLYLARQAGGFSAKSIGTSSGLSDDARSFATCAQLPSRGYILSWTGAAFVFQSVADDTGGTVATQTPPPLLSGVAPRELFLACGPNRVHAFAIFGQASPSNPLLGASWDPKLGWSSWANVVLPNTTNLLRCFLTGFDRVAGAIGDQVGIAWSEVTACSFPYSADTTSTYAAFVKVTDS
jgi:hypothetical protein